MMAEPLQASTRIFPCESCGADLAFHIEAETLKCPYCSFEKELAPPEGEIAERDLEAVLAREASRHGASALVDASEASCTSCGASILFEKSVTSTECPYCATPVQRDDVHQATSRIAVDAVLPFAVERSEARTGLAEWVGSRWFAPNAFKKRGVQGRFEGVYLPFFTFDAMTHTSYSGRRGDHYYETVGSGKNQRRVRRTRWSFRSGSFRRFFDDMLVCCARSVERKLVDALEPWPVEQAKNFDPAYLAGYVAMTYDIDIAESFTMARQRISAELSSDVRGRIGGDEQQILTQNTSYEALTFKHLLMPLWLLSYRFEDKSYRVMVNACTGEIHGSRPYSWIKITLAALAGVAIAAGAYLLSQPH